MAAVQSVLSGGEVRGVRLLSAAGCERALEEQFAGQDRCWACADRLRHGLRRAGRPHLLLGRLGRLARPGRPRRPDDGAYVMNRMLEQGTLGDDRGLGS